MEIGNVKRLDELFFKQGPAAAGPCFIYRKRVLYFLLKVVRIAFIIPLVDHWPGTIIRLTVYSGSVESLLVESIKASL